MTKAAVVIDSIDLVRLPGAKRMDADMRDPTQVYIKEYCKFHNIVYDPSRIVYDPSRQESQDNNLVDENVNNLGQAGSMTGVGVKGYCGSARQFSSYPALARNFASARQQNREYFSVLEAVRGLPEEARQALYEKLYQDGHRIYK